jgi:acetolactate synthase-1/3 small subunit
VNIESLAVGHSEEKGFSRMTFVVGGAENSVKNISSQLNKIIDIVDASDISEKNIVWRELALIKVKCNQSQRVEILELSKVFRVNVVDVGINNITFELAGGKSKIDSFVELLDQFGVMEVMRTGRIATLRGTTKIGINDGEFSESNNSDIYIADKDASGSV